MAQVTLYTPSLGVLSTTQGTHTHGAGVTSIDFPDQYTYHRINVSLYKKIGSNAPVLILDNIADSGEVPNSHSNDMHITASSTITPPFTDLTNGKLVIRTVISVYDDYTNETVSQTYDYIDDTIRGNLLAVPMTVNFSAWSHGGNYDTEIGGSTSVCLGGGYSYITPTFSDGGPTPTYQINYTAGAGGTIQGTLYQEVSSGGGTSIVTAIPNAGYQFVNWTGPGETTITSADLILSNVTQNHNYTANFQLIPTTTYSVAFITVASPRGGRVRNISTGETATDLFFTVVDGGNTPQIEAVSDSGYYFVNWTIYETTNSTIISATNVHETRVYQANFLPSTAVHYTLSYTAGAGGLVQIGNSSPQSIVAQSVASGYNGSIITAVPNTGYHFVEWQGFQTISINPTQDLNVIENRSYTAIFALDDITTPPSPSYEGSTFPSLLFLNPLQ